MWPKCSVTLMHEQVCLWWWSTCTELLHLELDTHSFDSSLKKKQGTITHFFSLSLLYFRSLMFTNRSQRASCWLSNTHCGTHSPVWQVTWQRSSLKEPFHSCDLKIKHLQQIPEHRLELLTHFIHIKSDKLMSACLLRCVVVVLWPPYDEDSSTVMYDVARL